MYDKYGGFCLETMAYVDAVNHPEFPLITLRPGRLQVLLLVGASARFTCYILRAQASISSKIGVLVS